MELDIERKRTAAPEMDDAGEKRRKVDSDFDLHHCPPSRVIHVRAVPDGSTQYDMMAAVQQFGKVRLGDTKVCANMMKLVFFDVGGSHAHCLLACVKQEFTRARVICRLSN